jgi:hypothetical protein
MYIYTCIFIDFYSECVSYFLRDNFCLDFQLSTFYLTFWDIFGNVVCHRVIVYDEIEKDKQLNLLDDALATLRLLNSANNKTWVPRIRHHIFRFLGQFLIRPNTKLVAGDFEGKDAFQTCVDAMKDSNRNWDFDEKVWNNAFVVVKNSIQTNIMTT